MCPTYAFECSNQDCKTFTERERKITDDLSTETCTKCKSSLQVVISSDALCVSRNPLLKGPDWPGQSIKKFKIFGDE